MMTDTDSIGQTPSSLERYLIVAAAAIVAIITRTYFALANLSAICRLSVCLSVCL